MSPPAIDRKIPFLRSLNRLMFGVSLVGILDTVHLLVQERFGFNKGCLGFVDSAIEQSFNCQQVISSDAGYMLGVSNTQWGIIFYIVASILLFLRITPLKKAGRLLNGFTTGLLSFAFLYTLYLLYYQSFVLGEYCLLCLISAALSTLLFLGEWSRFYYLERHNFQSINEGDSSTGSNEVSWRSIIWIGVIIVAIADIGLAGYQSSIEKKSPTASSSQVPKKSLILHDVRSINLPDSESTQCKYEAVGTDTISRNLTSFYDPLWGNPTSKVSIVFYFDPLDPATISMIEMLKTLRDQSPQNLAISFKPIPLSAKGIPVVLSLYQAHRQNRFFSYLSSLHHPQTKSDKINRRIQRSAERPEVSMQGLRFENASALIKNRLLMEVQKARSAGFDHFPSILINGRKVDEQSLTLNCIHQLTEKEF